MHFYVMFVSIMGKDTVINAKVFSLMLQCKIPQKHNYHYHLLQERELEKLLPHGVIEEKGWQEQ